MSITAGAGNTRTVVGIEAGVDPCGDLHLLGDVPLCGLMCGSTQTAHQEGAHYAANEPH
jgi:hypothetical protein